MYCPFISHVPIILNFPLKPSYMVYDYLLPSKFDTNFVLSKSKI